MSLDISGSTVFGTAVAVNTTTATGTLVPANAAHGAYLDYGAAHFTSGWSIQGQFNISALSATSASFFMGVNDQAGIAFVTGSGTDNANVMGCVAVNTTTFNTNVRDKVAGTQHNVTGTYVYAINTDYYYTLYNLSSLGGQYGVILSQVFSDSARTTLLETVKYTLTAANSSQYFYPMQSINNGNTYTISGAHSNFTLGTVSAGVDLTTYTTSGAALAAYANIEVITALPGTGLQYTYKDDGVGHWAGNYTVTGALNITAWPSGTAGSVLVGVVSNTAANYTGHLHAFRVAWASATTATIKLLESDASTNAESSGSITHTLGTPLWIKRWRDTTVGTYGTIYAQAYSDPALSVTFGSQISLALRENLDYRYSYSVLTYAGGTSTVTGTFGGFNLLITSSAAGSGIAVATGAAVALGLNDSSGSGTVVTTGAGVGTSLFSAIGSGIAVATGSAVGLLLSAGSAVGDGVSVSTGSAVGSSVWSAVASGTAVATGYAVGSGTIPISYTAYILCRITKLNATTGQEEGVTSFTTDPSVKFFRTTDLYSLDFSDSTFKADASCVTISATMSAKNATSYPGWYVYQLSTYGLGAGAKTTYVYSIDATIDSTTTYMNEGEMIFLDGVEVLPGLTVAENLELLTTTPAAISGVPAATLAAAAVSPIAANIKQVNDVTIQGAGISGNSMRPV